MKFYFAEHVPGIPHGSIMSRISRLWQEGLWHWNVEGRVPSLVHETHLRVFFNVVYMISL